MHKATTSTPTAKAPNSAHIMWVKPTAFGGQVGLPVSGDQESQYTSTSILYRQFEPIILNGIISTNYTPTHQPRTSAVEHPVGQQLTYALAKQFGHKDTKTRSVFGCIMQFHTIQEYGTQAFLVEIGPSVGTGASSIQHLATIRPNDWILHRQHHKYLAQQPQA